MIEHLTIQTIATYTNLSLSEVKRLLSLSPDEIARDPDYMELVHSLDSARLEASLQEARKAFLQGLQPIADNMMHQYQLTHNPMSAYTLGNWLVGFSESGDITMFQGLHTDLPLDMIATYLPPIIGTLDTMTEGRNYWQHALSVMAISLLSSAN